MCVCGGWLEAGLVGALLAGGAARGRVRRLFRIASVCAAILLVL